MCGSMPVTVITVPFRGSSAVGPPGRHAPVGAGEATSPISHVTRPSVPGGGG